MVSTLIEQYAAGSEKLTRTTAGLTAAQWLATPVPGKWSMHQLVIHLADAEMAFADRIKRIIAQDDPALLAWDEARFIERLHYEAQSAEDALLQIAATRRQISRILKVLPDAIFDRAGTHSEAGRMTLSDVIAKASWHLEHHLKFAEEKRKILVK